MLDTHIFLWWVGESPRITPAIRQQISEAARVYVSSVSAAEIGIKSAVGKLTSPEPVGRAIGKSGFEPLAFTVEHAERLADLPLHHRDPFDRMLIVQAQAEGLTVLTADALFRAYDVPLITA